MDLNPFDLRFECTQRHELSRRHGFECCQHLSVKQPIDSTRVLIHEACFMSDMCSILVTGAKHAVEHWHRLFATARVAVLSRLLDLVAISNRFLRAGRVTFDMGSIMISLW